ncbi:G-protein coupled receptor 4-like [Toxotes jaculatrix]|uniref:G-protein coupled receptor 4-like n=1 Tax=Toxotes jaculatrix TaxID=941984 RepID=UPI001B3A83E6|nr:G-protein coupled receptor 4-like [Toxotes jaculatrix]
MEDFYNNTTSQNSSDGKNGEQLGIKDVIYVIDWIVISIGLPLTILAIHALYSLVRQNHVAPIYIINLLISDLIQFCCTIFWLTRPEKDLTFHVFASIHDIALAVSVGFMTCVAVERYLLIAWPLWYRFKRSIKFSPLADLVLYVFMRKGAFDRLLACLCCRKSETQQTSGQTITVSDDVEA